MNDLATWRDKDVLEKLEKKAPSLPNFYQLKQDHAGYIVSSYSRMKRIESGELDPLERDEFRREPGQKTLATVLADDELPGGTATGTMLHEILENDPVRFAGGEAFSGRLARARADQGGVRRGDRPRRHYHDGRSPPACRRDDLSRTHDLDPARFGAVDSGYA